MCERIEGGLSCRRPGVAPSRSLAIKTLKPQNPFEIKNLNIIIV
jgi:hypothetical protein